MPVPLWAPLRGASLADAVSRFFKKYATFSGRASSSVPGTGYVIGLILAGIWFLLLGFIPFVGGITLLVFTLLDSTPEGQRFDAPAQQAGAWRP